MKLYNYCENGAPALGLHTENGDFCLSDAGLGHSVDELIAAGEAGLAALRGLELGRCRKLAQGTPRFLPAVLAPGKILCVGLNYRAHAKEIEMELPPYPTIFSKFPSALAAHGERIPLYESAKNYDYEAELTLIIGRGGRDIPEQEALSHVFAYTCGNDLTARELQSRTTQWLLGKTPDKFCPLGPYAVVDEVADPGVLDIACYVNGERRQSSNTERMIFTPAFLISYISRYLTLSPGDIIMTGTPSGVMQGYPADQKRWLVPGDVVEVCIEGLGTLRNELIKG